MKRTANATHQLTPLPVGLRLISERHVQAICRRVMKDISDGRLAPGQKLPTEREIATKFTASRYTVRKALTHLEKEGSIVRRVGSGTFIAKDFSQIHADLGPLAKDTSPSELMEIRLLLEPGTARIAAARASESELAFMKKCLAESENARNWQDCEYWDGELHKTIIRATKNTSLIKIAEFIHDIRHEQKWIALKTKAITVSQRQMIRRQHRSIVAAIASRDGSKAEQLLRAHLQYVKTNLFELD